ncbi:thioredoxin domain-containing protein [Leifsonia shinshuensis]|uniref:Thioredoxin domain-containing protein n=1 Tax=Leifsonia shinshuensis TaxID=150026 RepID=A0A7G6YFX2_9MICO|nr:thioredoxin domain-containing protein [Leifsonia shinshuensis]QNE37387.1 thioredoxin domain-containing protein [Leifsonia shinshuensis]
MTNRLAGAISPYLRAHAENPVDWFPWGPEAFAEARRRDVPVIVSIGYATCHWCHVMARESFSDPAVAALMNERFVSIKVDREEHPDVDAAYLSAASAFTEGLGWPLTVFATSSGRAFFAGTYFPPVGMGGRPSFTQILDAVVDAWTERRAEVESDAGKVGEALASAAARATTASELPDGRALDTAVGALAETEDPLYGGFGGAPKFPVAPVLGFLLDRPSGRELAQRTLRRMADSPLRDAVDGGFFRYATRRDWSDPHYERMLYDNAQLLDAYATAWAQTGEEWAERTADGVAAFLLGVLRRPGGAFASAQDSESTIDGARVEGGYYHADPAERARLTPPAIDEKVLTGWNGFAIGALARAGRILNRPAWIVAAGEAARSVLETHRRPDGTLGRASVDGAVSDAVATLEDYGGLAGGLLELAAASGDVEAATAARELVDLCLEAADGGDCPFAVPGGGDPLLQSTGLAVRVDPSEGAYPSGLTATASAAHTLFLMTAGRRYERAAREAMRLVAGPAASVPSAFGAALALMSRLEGEPQQLVVVSEPAEGVAGKPDADPEGLVAVARRHPADLVALVEASQGAALAEAGFELFAARGTRDGLPTAYLCRDFVCKLPVTTPAGL